MSLTADELRKVIKEELKEVKQKQERMELLQKDIITLLLEYEKIIPEVIQDHEEKLTKSIQKLQQKDT